MKRFINIYVPVTTCNMKCSYCYISQSGLWKQALPKFKYDAKTVRNALSIKRLGGECHINICGGGETLLPEEIVDIVKELLLEGHYIFIVTNGTVSKRFDQFLQFDDVLLKRLGFKFSLHYLQLVNYESLMKSFLRNVYNIQKSVCSYSIEMTPSDDLIPYIDEIKEFCMKEFGALCHVTVARDTVQSEVPILTNLSKKEYIKTWGTFNSDMFNFKIETFNVVRTEYCYAGDWSLWVNLGTGNTTQCYSSCFQQNIFENTDKPIKFCAVGHKCKVPHCHNSHALLTLGVIPEINSHKYADIRDRVTVNGEHWLNPEMREFLSRKLSEQNCSHDKTNKLKNTVKQKMYRYNYLVKKVVKKNV